MEASEFRISPQHQARLEQLALDVIGVILDASEGGNADQQTAKLYMGITMFIGILTTHESIAKNEKEDLK